MRLTLGLLAATILFWSSCKKENSVESMEPITELTPEYTPMSVGDYWVYEVFHVDSNGNDSAINQIDSVSITNDTLINGETYYVYRGTKYLYSQDPNQILFMLRDSSGYIINETGIIFFSDVDFNSKFNENVAGSNGDTNIYTYSKMEPGVIQYTTPAGTFGCLVNKVIAQLNFPNQPSYTKEYSNLYGQNVGLVLETYGYVSQPYVFERRLIDYQVVIGIP